MFDADTLLSVGKVSWDWLKGTVSSVISFPGNVKILGEDVMVNQHTRAINITKTLISRIIILILIIIAIRQIILCLQSKKVQIDQINQLAVENIKSHLTCMRETHQRLIGLNTDEVDSLKGLLEKDIERYVKYVNAEKEILMHNSYRPGLKHVKTYKETSSNKEDINHNEHQD
ncbi:Hypothetical_protein [Hexamita inflata]|uniref:Hypothetical_protein n=1 Tax=Hexamita inflata TaxID=28002 RepID=A0AA86PZX9_9EUKA|nr:Hypothetical protein HINF_LOCUS31945 [Hexamita inflata]